MSHISRDIFRAIHESKWLYVEYKNQDTKTTRYWFGIETVDIQNLKLHGIGLHLGTYTKKELTLFLSGIQSTQIVDGTYMPINTALVDDIKLNPVKYQSLFDSTANLKVLNYLSDCNKL